MPHPHRGWLQLIASVIALSACSSDSAVTPGQPRPTISPTAMRTLTLTRVNAKPIPAVYVSGVGGTDGWADSGSATVQADSFVAFRIYVTATAAGAAHHAQQPTSFSLGGKIIDAATVRIDYVGVDPDYATINPDGSILMHLTGVVSGTKTSYGDWLFSGPYTGPLLNPAPYVSGITPQVIPQYAEGYPVKVRGSSFMPQGVVTFQGFVVPATYVNSGEFDVVLPATASSHAGYNSLKVINPTPGGGYYEYSYVVVSAPPVLSSVSPPAVAVGSAPSPITITGSALSDNSIVTWNGSPRATIFESPTSLRIVPTAVDYATPGVVQIAVVTPQPGGGTSVSYPFRITGSAPQIRSQVVAKMSVRAIAADPVRGVVYAALDSVDANNPRSIVALDGTTGAILWTQPITGTPKVMAVSTDGQYLYLGKLRDSIITRFVLATHTPDITISLGLGPAAPYQAQAIYPIPGSARSFAVQREAFNEGYSWTDTGIEVFDDNVARPATSSAILNFPVRYAFNGTPSTMYGLADGSLLKLALSPSGAATVVNSSIGTVSSSTGPETVFMSGNLYTTNGYVVDPVAARFLPSPSPWAPFTQTLAAGTDGHTLYTISAAVGLLQAFDVQTGGPAGSMSLPGSYSTNSGLVRIGADGLAYIASTRNDRGEAVVLIHSDFVH